MGAGASRCHIKARNDKSHDEPVIGTIVEQKELFRSDDLVLFRIAADDGQKKRYLLARGERHATFETTLILAESFLAEIRARSPESQSKVAVVNATGMHLTHLFVTSSPNEYHDEKAKTKLTNLLHALP